MEINKQLFEDIFSGKLKGTFVLRSGDKVNSKELKRNNSYYSKTHPYQLVWPTYTSNGKTSLCGYTNLNDIIDFIPDSDMKQNSLTIEIPNDKIVDWDESRKQNKIVLKDKQLTYEDVCKKLFENKYVFYTNANGRIDSAPYSEINDSLGDKNNITTKHQLECILAKNQLANVAKYLNDGRKPELDDNIFLLIQNTDSFSVYPVANGSCASDCGSIWFKSRKTAEQAIEILGEETVKLALEPLGI